ncbi:WD40 repeat domain-containing serine/threonine protein kinase [Nonomuraea spiralis]|uniref:WD40 repeat domain-containing serine/threonine protein kinase n=1 Tax=Nonomuraea spiralis TaxID=46182 RepID=UPI00378CE959
MEELLPDDPQRIADYWLAGRLGSGGQGVVYEAYDAAGTRVALKVLRSGDLRGRWAKEVAVAQRVASFCTAKILGARLDGERPYIVSEYVEGPSLRRAVRESGAFSGDALYRLAIAMATALAAIHEAGVVHRDLKPDNVLLGPDGPRVIDFGIARATEMTLTSTTSAAGTPTYMAPEVISGGRAETSADLFAWGAVILFAATGQDPFRAGNDNPYAHMQRVLSAQPDLGALADPLRPLVAAALAKTPAERPTARELLLALIGGNGNVALLSEGSREGGGVAPPHADPDPALGERAERLYEELSPEIRELVPGMLLRLVAIDDEGRETLRRTPAGELPQAAVTAFSDLLSVTGEWVRLAHPALVKAWPRLRGWYAAERDGLPTHRRLAEDAWEWDAGGRQDADLPHGSLLESLRDWTETRPRLLTLTPVERAYVAGGVRLASRRRLRRRWFTGVLVVLLGVAVTASVLADQQRRLVSGQRDRALSESLAAQAVALRRTDPKEGMLLAVAAYRVAPTVAARGAMYGALTQVENEVFVPPERPAGRYALNHDGSLLAGTDGTTAAVWRVDTREQVRSVSGLEPRAEGIALSPDGGRLALQYADHLTIRDLATGQTWTSGKDDSWDAVVAAEMDFSPDGRFLSLPNESGTQLDLTTKTPVRTPSGDAEAVSPDGRLALLTTMDDQNRMHAEGWNPVTRERAAPWLKTMTHAVFSDDGSLVAISDVTRVRVRKSATGEQVGTLKPTGMDIAAFGPDHTMIAVLSNRRLTLSAVDGRRLLTYDTRGQQLVEHVPRFSRDGRVLRLLSSDGTVTSLDLTRYRENRPTGDDVPMSPVHAGDGRYLLSDAGGGRVMVWRPDGRLFRTVRAGRLEPTDFTTRFTMDRTGRVLATSSSERPREIQLWDVATGAKRAKLTTSGFSVTDLSFGPDGRVLAAGLAAYDEGRRGLLLWDTVAGTARTVPGVENSGVPLVFTPDGRRLVVTGDPPSLVDVATARPLPLPDALREVSTIAFGPSLAAVADFDGIVRIWDGGLTRLIGRFETGKGVGSLAVSPDGATVAAVTDAGLMFWDVPTRTRVGGAQPLYLAEDGERPVDLRFDGPGLHVLLDAGTGGDVPVDGGLLASRVCARAAGARLSAQRWDQYAPGVAPVTIC